MVLTWDQRMAAELGLDVDNPFGRAASKGRQWPGGVLVYAIHPTLGKSRPVAVKTLNISVKGELINMTRAWDKESNP